LDDGKHARRERSGAGGVSRGGCGSEGRADPGEVGRRYNSRLKDGEWVGLIRREGEVRDGDDEGEEERTGWNNDQR